MTLIHLAHGQKNEWRKHYERKSNRAKINADGKKAGRHLSKMSVQAVEVPNTAANANKLSIFFIFISI